MVVPIYKRWEANNVRLQVVEQENVVQLLAFFEDFSHADCMNFPLKSMDVFEKVEKGGKAAIRLVDAKFWLPPEEKKGEVKGEARKFVCLDMPEYPGEHDDITISFDSQAGKACFSLLGARTPVFVHVFCFAAGTRTNSWTYRTRSVRAGTPGSNAGY
jgi:hypothetical protein